MSDPKNTTYVIRQVDEETGALMVVDILQYDLFNDPKKDRRHFMRTIGRLYDQMHDDLTLTELHVTFRGD